MKDVLFKDERQAIEDAVRDGILSDNPAGDNFAGHYVYLGHFHGIGKFKHKVAPTILEHAPSGDAASPTGTACAAATGE